MTWGELVRKALLTANIAPLLQEVAPELNQAAREALLFVLSEWSRDGVLPPNLDAVEGTLIPGTNVYTAGTGGTLFARRPVQATQAILFDATLGLVRRPIPVFGWDDFEDLTFPSAPGMPNALYFNESYPLAQVGTYPTPNSNWKVRLTGQFAWDTPDFDAQISLPPGYDSAICDATAVRTCEDLNREVAPRLANRAQRGRAAIETQIPPMERVKNNRRALALQRGKPRNWLTEVP